MKHFFYKLDESLAAITSNKLFLELWSFFLTDLLWIFSEHLSSHHVWTGTQKVFFLSHTSLDCCLSKRLLIILTASFCEVKAAFESSLFLCQDTGATCIFLHFKLLLLVSISSRKLLFNSRMFSSWWSYYRISVSCPKTMRCSQEEMGKEQPILGFLDTFVTVKIVIPPHQLLRWFCAYGGYTVGVLAFALGRCYS